MSWRDQITQQSVGGRAFQGSYGGAVFIVPSNQLMGGRRTAVHELPQRDLPIVDDLGGKAKEFEIEVFVDGSLAPKHGTYMDARDALLDQLDKAGAATLVHPWYGRVRVQQKSPYRVREENRNGGRATFTLALIQVAAIVTEAPSSSVHTPTHTQQAVTTAQAAATTDFSNTWNVDGLPDFHLAELTAELSRTLGAIEATVGGVTSAVAAEIRSPYNMGAAIIGFVNEMADIVTEPLRALRLYQGLFAAGNDSPAIPTTTAVRIQEAASANALHAIVQRGAVIAAARQSSLITYDNRDQALSIRDTLLDALDAQMMATDPLTGSPIDDDVYQALETLRAAVAEDLRSRGAQLPQLATFTPAAKLPALVIAQRLYGDYTRADEIIARNDITHPGFVAGGNDLEVLSV